MRTRRTPASSSRRTRMSSSSRRTRRNCSSSWARCARVIARIYRRPAQAQRAFYIFTASSFMKEAANSLLKILEEPPEHATLILLAENPSELLPTIRSRAGMLRLGALPPAEIDALLAARRPELKAAAAHPRRPPRGRRSRSRAGLRSACVSRLPPGCAHRTAHLAGRARLQRALPHDGELPRRRRRRAKDLRHAACIESASGRSAAHPLRRARR